MSKESKEYKQLKDSIKNFGYVDLIIIDNNFKIIGGHQRLPILKELGYKEIDVVQVDHLNETQIKTLNIALNKIEGQWDFEKLELLLNELKKTDKELFAFSGFDDEEFEKMKKTFDIHFTGEQKNDNDAEDQTGNFSNDEAKSYTDKILAPIYEPKMEKSPDIKELFNDKKYLALIDSIKKSKASKEVKDFLKLTATRFIRFDYGKIAEFYCHSDKEIQELFEQLALIIIDFKKAIENGFIEMQDAIYSENEKEDNKNEE